MIQLSSEDSFDKNKGIFSAPDEAVPSHVEGDGWRLSVWHFLWIPDGAELEKRVKIIKLWCAKFIPW